MSKSMIKLAVYERFMKELKKEYPGSSEEHRKIAINGFIEYIKLNKIHKNVPMYSKSVDFVWHTFILDTKEYATFCEEQLGVFLHHIPNTDTPSVPSFNYNYSEELKTLFLDACSVRGINPFEVNSIEEAPYLFQADYYLEKDWINPGSLSLSIRDDKQQVPKQSKWSLFGKRSEPTPYQSKVNNTSSDVYNYSRVSDMSDLLLPMAVGLGTAALVTSVLEEDSLDEYRRRSNDTIVPDSSSTLTSGFMCVSSTPYNPSTDVIRCAGSSSSSPSVSSCGSSSCGSSSSTTSSCGSSSGCGSSSSCGSSSGCSS